MRCNNRLLVTLLSFALMFYIIGTLEQIERVICLLAIVAIIYGIWNRR